MIKKTSALSLVFSIIFTEACIDQAGAGNIAHHAKHSTTEVRLREMWHASDAKPAFKLAEFAPRETEKRPPLTAWGKQPITAKKPHARLSPREAEQALGLNKSDRVRVQKWLDALGYSPGGADGVFGPNSRKAIARLQTDAGEEPTGYLDSSLYVRLTDPMLRRSLLAKRPAKPLTAHLFRKVHLVLNQALERFHYDKRLAIDVAFAQRVLKRIFSTLDPNRSFFLQGDVDKFLAHPESLAAAITRGKLDPYFRIFNGYRERVNQRLDAVTAVLDQDFDFSVQETYRFDRSKAPWAKSKAELDEIWRKRIKSDYLGLLLLDLDPETVTRKLRKRYQRTGEIINGFKDSDIAQFALNAFAQSVDEHTQYLGPALPVTPSIDIGLDLSESGGLVVVQDVVPGGPADRNGLVPGDVILAVGQGPDGAMEDVVGSYFGDVVDKINGPRDTLVRLRITRHRSGLSGPSREVGIVRVETPLEGQVTGAYIIDDLEGAPGMLIGVVALPAFYRDVKAESEGNRDFHSSARDLEEILTEFKQAGVAGVLLDLRGNGGGSFLEAVAVAGLFIESGPIVQVKDSFGKLEKELDPDPNIAFAGPLAVLVDHKSAAASEIVAAAIQDYQRGIIVGERTFGRGSIQTLIDLNRFVPGSTEDIGRLLLTMAMFFRPVGDGVQLRGVEPDLVFPTDTVGLLREQDRANPMPWGRIDPIQVSAYGFTMKPDVFTRHLARVGKDRVFQSSIDLIRLLKPQDAVTTVSLNESQRRADESRLGQEVAALLGIFSNLGEIGEDVTLADLLSIAGLREAAMVLSDCIRTGCFRE